jgi:hypothetical protein
VTLVNLVQVSDWQSVMMVTVALLPVMLEEGLVLVAES